MFKSNWTIEITEQHTPIHAGLNPVYINPDKSMKTETFWTKAYNKLNSLLYTNNIQLPVRIGDK